MKHFTWTTTPSEPDVFLFLSRHCYSMLPFYSYLALFILGETHTQSLFCFFSRWNLLKKKKLSKIIILSNSSWSLVISTEWRKKSNIFFINVFMFVIKQQQRRQQLNSTKKSVYLGIIVFVLHCSVIIRMTKINATWMYNVQLAGSVFSGVERFFCEFPSFFRVTFFCIAPFLFGFVLHYLPESVHETKNKLPPVWQSNGWNEKKY